MSRSHYQLVNQNIVGCRKLFAVLVQHFWLAHHFRLVFDKQPSGNSSCSKVIGKESSYNKSHLGSLVRHNLLSSWNHSFKRISLSVTCLLHILNKRRYRLLYKTMPQDASWVFHYSNDCCNGGAIILNKRMCTVVINWCQLSNLMKSSEPPVCLLSSESMLSI
jgi:hypothetical protein